MFVSVRFVLLFIKLNSNHCKMFKINSNYYVFIMLLFYDGLYIIIEICKLVYRLYYLIFAQLLIPIPNGINAFSKF